MNFFCIGRQSSHTQNQLQTTLTQDLRFTYDAGVTLFTLNFNWKSKNVGGAPQIFKLVGAENQEKRMEGADGTSEGKRRNCDRWKLIHSVNPLIVAVKDDAAANADDVDSADDSDDDSDGVGQGATHSIVLDGISACSIIPRAKYRTSLGPATVRNSSVIAQWWKSFQHLCLSQTRIAKANCKVSDVCLALLHP